MKRYGISYTLLSVIECEEDEIGDLVSEQIDKIKYFLKTKGDGIGLNDVEYDEL